jgi:hypothetical protein
MIKLPKLVEEKIDNYINYMNYQSWKKSIEIVHNEYKDRVYREDREDRARWDYNWIYYKIDDYSTFPVITRKKIEHLRKINIFRRYDKEYLGLRVPKNYVYSSGYPNLHSFTDPKSHIEDLKFGCK